MSESLTPATAEARDLEASLYHLLPEWSACRAVLLAWPFPGSDWDDSMEAVTTCYWQIMDALLADVSDPVQAWVLLHPTMDQALWLESFDNKGLPRAQLKVVHHIAYDDTWIRDYGPLSKGMSSTGMPTTRMPSNEASTGSGFSCGEYVDFAFNGWGGKFPAEADDEVSAQLAGCLEQMPVRHEWVLEGGALDVNGAGTLLANKNCVIDPLRNPSLNEQQICRLLKEHLGVTTIEWVEGICLTGDDTDGHIDTIARFCAEDCIVYAGRNNAHPDSEILESLHQQLTAIAQRNQWRLLELPSPLIHSQLDGRMLPATYTNFLIVNQRVLAPVYGVPEDTQALAVLQLAFPMRTIVPVNCAALVEQHGSLHCATMQVAQQQVRV